MVQTIIALEHEAGIHTQAQRLLIERLNRLQRRIVNGDQPERQNELAGAYRGRDAGKPEIVETVHFGRPQAVYCRAIRTARFGKHLQAHASALIAGVRIRADVLGGYARGGDIGADSPADTLRVLGQGAVAEVGGGGDIEAVTRRVAQRAEKQIGATARHRWRHGPAGGMARWQSRRFDCNFGLRRLLPGLRVFRPVLCSIGGGDG